MVTFSAIFFTCSLLQNSCSAPALSSVPPPAASSCHVNHCHTVSPVVKAFFQSGVQPCSGRGVPLPAVTLSMWSEVAIWQIKIIEAQENCSSRQFLYLWVINKDWSEPIKKRNFFFFYTTNNLYWKFKEIVSEKTGYRGKTETAICQPFWMQTVVLLPTNLMLLNDGFLKLLHHIFLTSSHVVNFGSIPSVHSVPYLHVVSSHFPFGR